MSTLQRRDLLTRSMAFGSAAEALGLADRTPAGDPSFTNVGHDPLLAGKELPRFTFALEKSKPGRLIGGSFAREATVAQFPISKGIAGVSMTLEPGAMRELHWHDTVAEWAYVNQGRVRTTVIAPGGDCLRPEQGPQRRGRGPEGEEGDSHHPIVPRQVAGQLLLRLDALGTICTVTPSPAGRNRKPRTAGLFAGRIGP
jgi:hypothetical protein